MQIHTFDFRKKIYNLDIEDYSVEALDFLRSDLLEKALITDDVRVPRLRHDGLEGKATAYGYRVVRKDGNSSLGLRKNPHILNYPIGDWFELPDSWQEPGNGDWGGIWICRTPSQAKTLQKYMDRMYGVETRAFKAYFKDILHFNDYRIKTDAMKLDKELFF